MTLSETVSQGRCESARFGEDVEASTALLEILSMIASGELIDDCERTLLQEVAERAAKDQTMLLTLLGRKPSKGRPKAGRGKRVTVLLAGRRVAKINREEGIPIHETRGNDASAISRVAREWGLTESQVRRGYERWLKEEAELIDAGLMPKKSVNN